MPPAAFTIRVRPGGRRVGGAPVWIPRTVPRVECAPGHGDGAGRRNIVVARLGAGASLCAVQDGRSVDTTMGFTPLDGLVMATGPGTLDPGLVPWLILQRGLNANGCRTTSRTIQDWLRWPVSPRCVRSPPEPRAGTRKQSRRSASTTDSAPPAHVAGDGCRARWVGRPGFHRRRRENDPVLRERACRELAWLGLRVDPDRNNAARGVDADITDGDRGPRVLDRACPGGSRNGT